MIKAIVLILSLSIGSSSIFADTFEDNKEVLKDCKNWVTNNDKGKKDLSHVAIKRCEEFTKVGKFPKNAYSLCKNIKTGARASDSHPVYTFSSCLRAIKDNSFSEDSLAVIKKYIKNDDVYFLLNSLKKSKDISATPALKKFASREKVAAACKEWVGKNNENKPDLARIALGHCIGTAINGNFPSNAFEICKSIPAGTKSSGTHQVYSFDKCISKIKNTTPKTEDLQKAVWYCEKLQGVPTIGLKIEIFNDMLEYLIPRK